MTDYKAEAKANIKSADEWWAKQNADTIKMGGSTAELAEAALSARASIKYSGL